MRRYRRWCAAISRTMIWLLRAKANHLSFGEKIALVVCRTSPVTWRLNHINLHYFWDRRPNNSRNCMLWWLWSPHGGQSKMSPPMWQDPHAQAIGESSPYAFHLQRHSHVCTCSGGAWWCTMWDVEPSARSRASTIYPATSTGTLSAPSSPLEVARRPNEGHPEKHP